MAIAEIDGSQIRQHSFQQCCRMGIKTVDSSFLERTIYRSVRVHVLVASLTGISALGFAAPAEAKSSAEKGRDALVGMILADCAPDCRPDNAYRKDVVYKGITYSVNYSHFKNEPPNLQVSYEAKERVKGWRIVRIFRDDGADGNLDKVTWMQAANPNFHHFWKNLKPATAEERAWYAAFLASFAK